MWGGSVFDLVTIFQKTTNKDEHRSCAFFKGGGPDAGRPPSTQVPAQTNLGVRIGVPTAEEQQQLQPTRAKGEKKRKWLLGRSSCCTAAATAALKRHRRGHGGASSFFRTTESTTTPTSSSGTTRSDHPATSLPPPSLSQRPFSPSLPPSLPLPPCLPLSQPARLLRARATEVASGGRGRLTGPAWRRPDPSG